MTRGILQHGKTGLWPHLGCCRFVPARGRRRAPWEAVSGGLPVHGAVQEGSRGDTLLCLCAAL